MKKGTWTIGHAMAAGLVLLTHQLPAAGAQPTAPTGLDPGAKVGPAPGGGTIVTTTQLVRPVGRTAEIDARPVDLVVSPDGHWVFTKHNKGVTVLNAQTWTPTQTIKFPSDKGGSMHGMAISADGAKLYATDAQASLVEFEVEGGTLRVGRVIKVPGPGGKGSSFPCGVALSADGKTAYVALSCNNTLAEVDLVAGAVRREVEVAIAPYAVALTPDGTRALVTCWGGEKPASGEPAATSAGTPVAITSRGIAASGGLAIVDLASGSRAYVETGPSACGLAVSPGGETAFVANANNDTIAVVDVARGGVERVIVTRPGDLPFGSMPNGLAWADAGKTLLASCAGNNALAVIDVSDLTKPAVRGWVPTGWYPGGVAVHEGTVYAANIKGVGSRNARASDGAFNTHRHKGTLQALTLPDAAGLAAWTSQVIADARVPQILQNLSRAKVREENPAQVIPSTHETPGLIEHVFYIIKENRTYDQVFGDFAAGPSPKGNGAPSLCIYGRDVTPNQHALAEQFVLLDNFYCNGVLSADGHSWATEGNVTPYLERSFGGFTRSYTFGDDPLTYSSSGFIWDQVLSGGFSYRNFGEFRESKVVPPGGAPVGAGKGSAEGGTKGGKGKWIDVWNDRQSGTHAYGFIGTIGVENVRRYSSEAYPGWNTDIPDQVRADVFIKEFGELDAAGTVPNFVTIYLPQDHTMGVSPGGPTPRACVADNDYALGRIVEAISHSKAWGSTCIFVIEDDPQDGWDHVDGHRSIAQVISPYSRRGAVVSDFYTQASVVHTILRMFNLNAMNQLTAAAPLMTRCLYSSADLANPAAFTAIPPTIPLDELSPPKKAAAECEQRLYELTEEMDLSRPDLGDEDDFNRVHWFAAKGCDTPYPVALAGAHGSGLAALGLRLDPNRGVDDEEDFREEPEPMGPPFMAPGPPAR